MLFSVCGAGRSCDIVSIAWEIASLDMGSWCVGVVFFTCRSESLLSTSTFGCLWCFLCFVVGVCFGLQAGCAIRRSGRLCYFANG